MANRIPLIVNPTASQIQELPASDTLVIGEGGLGVFGSVALGNDSNTDQITLSSRFNSSLIPTDNNRNLGSSSLRWDEVYVNTVNVDSNVASSSTITGALQVAGGVGIGSSVYIGGALNVDDDITAFASSDRDYKDNLTPIPNALDKVGILTGYTFTWNSKSAYEGQEGVGVVAQEVEALGLAGITTTRVTDGKKGVRYDRLTAILIEAIKELKKENDNLKTLIKNSSSFANLKSSI